MKITRLLLVVVWMAGSYAAISQSYFFSTLNAHDGLPSDIINSIAQDKNHFIWIGTGNGLARYDGYRFKIFKREDHENSLPFNEISSLLVDGNYLWVGTWRGLCKINTTDLTVQRIDLSGSNIIRCLYKTRSGEVWIGTATGLIRMNDKGHQQHYSKENSGLSHNTIRTLYEDNNGNLWVGTYDRLNKLEAGSARFVSYDLKGNYKPELKNNLICDIKPVQNSETEIWVGTETGLALFDTRSNEFVSMNSRNSAFSNEVIKNIYTNADGKLWLGTDFGLNLYDRLTKKNETFFHNPQIGYSIANNVIWHIFEDAGGVIWIVTSNGLSRTHKQNQLFNFQEVTHKIGEQIVGNQVKALLMTRSGVLWIATIHGVIRIDPKDGSKRFFQSDSPPGERILLNNVFALEEDDQGRVWIGTAGGINVWDEIRNKMHSVTASSRNGLGSNYIARFIQTKDGSFWVSAWEGGLYKIVRGFNDLSDVKFDYAGDFGSEKITSSMNAMWAIQNNDLVRIDLNTYVQTVVPKFKASAKGNDVYNLYASARGTIWAGTLNGLIEYNPASDSSVLHPIITGNETIFNNIIGDDQNNIWAGANRCIVKFTKEKEKTFVFPLDKELPINSFYNNCSTRSANGELYFGGDNGYIVFSPTIQPNSYDPSVVITDIQINNKSVLPQQELNGRVLLTHDVAVTRSLNLRYEERSVGFEFSSLHFWQPEMNIYAYRLEGFDEQWHYVSGVRNFAVYSNLPPNDYTLRIKATNNYGVWSSSETSLKISISPPLFLSLPFKILYLALVGLVTFAIFRIYAIRLKLKNDVKIAVLEKEHAEEIVNAKQDFFTSISHELRTPISLIIPPIQAILKREKLDDEDRSLITIAEKNSQRLLRLINQILEYRKLEHENQSLTITWFDIVAFSQELYALFTDRAARNEIDFIFKSDKKECAIWADKEKIEIIIFNLLSNAFKFTPKNGRIEFTIHEDGTEFNDGSVVISVADTGIGIAEKDQEMIFTRFFQTDDARKFENGSGIGLTLVAEYVRMHRGKIKVNSKKGTGTNFTVMLPLGSSHFPVNENRTGNTINLLAVKPQTQPEQKYEFNLRSEKPLILLVEDNSDMVDFITLTLKGKYDFVVSTNGEEGLMKALDLIPDIIISDIMMPVMDGLELCRRVKKENRTSHIPIVLLTAKGLSSHKIEGLRVGADVYLTKPFEIEVLEAHIDHLLERKTELAQYFRHELVTEPIAEGKKDNEDDRFLKKVMNCIESNIANPDFSVELLSEEMGMSTTHLYRKLKSLTQVSANEIIKKYRIKKASLLLRNKEGNITEIMYEVGFSNLSYFSKCFKSEFGITPKEFQQKEGKHSFDIQADLE